MARAIEKTLAAIHSSNPIPLSVSLGATDIVLSWLATNQASRLEYTPNLASGWTTVTNTAQSTLVDIVTGDS